MALTAYQKHMKKELSGGKMKGKTAAQRKAIFKAAAKSYKAPKAPRKTLAQRARSVRTHRTNKPRSTVSRGVARKSGGRKIMSKGGFNSQKIMKYVRLAALVGPGAQAVMQYGAKDGAVHALLRYTGFDMRTGQFNGSALASGWGPYLASVAVTYGIPKLAGMIRGL